MPHTPSNFEAFITKAVKYPLALSIAYCFISSLHATPMLSQQDPMPIHSVYGTDKFFKGTNKTHFTLHVSPYFQHTSAASNGDNTFTAKGSKVPAGNMNGRWNMAALYFNPPAIPAGAFANYRQGLGTLQNPTITAAPTAGAAATGAAGTGLTGGVGQNLIINPNLFDPSPSSIDAVFTYQSVAITYEKIGMRGQMSYDIGYGLGMAVKGGFADYKQTPVFTTDPQLQTNLNPAAAGATPAASGAATTAATPTFGQPAATLIQTNLMSNAARNGIAKDLGIDLSGQRNTDVEDAHVNIYWNFPFKIHEQEQHVMSIVPYLAVGCWLPLGQDRNLNQPFSISVGNDGYTGITADGSIALDFPNMFQLSGGGGISFFMARNYTSYRIPTHALQVGMIPWTTPISREPGPIWYANVSLKTENFSPGFSGFFDFTYTEHLKDSITIKEPNATRAAFFLPAIAQDRSAWKIQQVTGGFIYNITSNVAISVAAQGTISGSRVYRPTTVLGSLIALF